MLLKFLQRNVNVFENTLATMVQGLLLISSLNKRCFEQSGPEIDQMLGLTKTNDSHAIVKNRACCIHVSEKACAMLDYCRCYSYFYGQSEMGLNVRVGIKRQSR